jgi:hypothetical protein
MLKLKQDGLNLFYLSSQPSKAVIYKKRPKMKRDARLKAGKMTAFRRASLFILGHSSYITALADLEIVET